jgi:hypothetical protein
MKLPELGRYTTEQMLAWGKACAEAEREACAKLCEAQGEYGWQQYAEAIRARGNT